MHTITISRDHLFEMQNMYQLLLKKDICRFDIWRLLIYLRNFFVEPCKDWINPGSTQVAKIAGCSSLQTHGALWIVEGESLTNRFYFIWLPPFNTCSKPSVLSMIFSKTKCIGPMCIYPTCVSSKLISISMKD